MLSFSVVDSVEPVDKERGQVLYQPFQASWGIFLFPLGGVELFPPVRVLSAFLRFRDVKDDQKNKLLQLVAAVLFSFSGRKGTKRYCLWTRISATSGLALPLGFCF